MLLTSDGRDAAASRYSCLARAPSQKSPGRRSGCLGIGPRALPPSAEVSVDAARGPSQPHAASARAPQVGLLARSLYVGREGIHDPEALLLDIPKVGSLRPERQVVGLVRSGDDGHEDAVP